MTCPAGPAVAHQPHRPEHRLVARGLVTDQHGRWLLVQNFTEPDSTWVIPGGHVELNEPPSVACAREVGEEAGVRVTAGRLLTIAWEPPNGRPSARTTMIFDCGRYDSDANPVTGGPDREHLVMWTMPREALMVMRSDLATALALWSHDPSAQGALYIEDPVEIQRRALAAAAGLRVPETVGSP